MLMKVVVVGCTHAGTAAVRELLTRHPETEVDVFERREDISFLFVALPCTSKGQSDGWKICFMLPRLHLKRSVLRCTFI